MNEKIKTFFSKFKYAIITFFVSLATVLFSFLLGLFKGKNISDNRNRTERTREQLGNIQDDCTRLRETNKSTETILKRVREREQKGDDKK